MVREPPELRHPIRVVVLTSGPTLERGVREFLRRLEEHPQIELLAAFCESADAAPGAVLRDLLRRRGLLGIPVLALEMARALYRYLRQPGQEHRLRRAITELRDRIHFEPDIHAASVLDRIRRLEPDLGLSYGSPILKPVLFQLPTFGTLGIHHGKVPEYRGKKTTFWALFNGEESAGVTIQRLTVDLDGGDVVRAGDVQVGRRSLRSVWAELEELGLDLYVAAILDVKRGRAVYRPQAAPRSELYRDPGLGDILVFWSRYLKRVLRG